MNHAGLRAAMAAIFLLGFIVSGCSDAENNDDELLLGLALVQASRSKDEGSGVADSSALASLNSENSAEAAGVSSAATSSIASVQATAYQRTVRMAKEQVFRAVEKKIRSQSTEHSTTWEDEFIATGDISCDNTDAGTYSGTGMISTLFTAETPDVSDLLSAEFSGKFTGEVTSMSMTVAFTECALEVYDYSQGEDAFPEDDKSVWPSIYVLLDGDITLEGSGSIAGSSTIGLTESFGLAVDWTLTQSLNLSVTSSNFEAVALPDVDSGSVVDVTGSELTGDGVTVELSQSFQEESVFHAIWANPLKVFSDPPSEGNLTWEASDSFSGTVNGEPIDWTLAGLISESDVDALYDYYSGSSSSKSPYSLYE